MNVHPDKTAVRAVDACGGTYSAAEIASGWAAGHTAALCDAIKAVVSADVLTAQLLSALIAAEDVLDDVVGSEDHCTDEPLLAAWRGCKTAIAAATGEQS